MKLSYLDAYYYKLLLEVGFSEDVNNWILGLAEKCDVLEGIYLDLVSNQGDNNKVISCLHNYIGEKDIDDDALATKLRLFILNKLLDKRRFKIKDFSNLMPGHGGVLDRLDSIIFVMLTFTFFIGIL